MKNYLLAIALAASAVKGYSQNLTASAKINTASEPDTLVYAASAKGVTANPAKSDQASTPVDGFYNYTILGNASPFNYPQINPANIRFYKRIWRDIDVTDPKNQVLAIPGQTLIETILEGVKTGQITAYDAVDDSFKYRLTSQQAMSKLVDSVLVPIFDDKGNQIDSKMTLNEFNPERVTKFRIKEDIFFDKQRSKVETRIIGIAPLMGIATGDTTLTNAQAPVFWLYFPECRNVFVKKDVSDPDKKMFDMSMDDIFIQRRFAGRIVKESSTSGQRIADYTKDLSEQEKEALRIESGIEAYKKNVWSYSNAENNKQ